MKNNLVTASVARKMAKNQAEIINHLAISSVAELINTACKNGLFSIEYFSDLSDSAIGYLRNSGYNIAGTSTSTPHFVITW